ncbi:MAG: 23S rRNA (guanosine(2251)-2'-O)-methyltransferase RlmB [candidate division Zixibacteria bacterium]|nr:23S rRNA (guanosine(2251)-2'-O)-methyltransferase RlmB [candidate division Zixibacteria bacterium]
MFSQGKSKEILKLKNKKFRQEQGKFIVEGVRSVEELLGSEWEVDALLYSVLLEKSNRANFILQKATSKKIAIEKVSQNILDKVSEAVSSSGIICVVKTKNLKLDDLLKGNPQSILVLDEVGDPGNLGTLIRTADAAGINGVILSEKTVELYSPKVVRSTMGSVFHLPIAENMDLVKSIQRLKREGFKIIASAVKGGEFYHKINYSGRVCLVVGNETKGVRAEILKLADKVASIPIYGQAESLNASVAGGILMYQMAIFKLIETSA